MIAIRQQPSAAQVFDAVFQVYIRIEKIAGIAAKPHAACGGGQDLQQAEVGPIAGLWTVGAFTDGKTVDQRAGDFVVVGPFVDQPAQLGRLVGIERQLGGRGGGLWCGTGAGREGRCAKQHLAKGTTCEGDHAGDSHR